MSDIQGQQLTRTDSENQRQLSGCSTPATSLSDIAPATAKQGTAELLACLTLVAPSGMTAEDRTAWVAVARQTLSGIPGDLLTIGCAHARKTCRFASEIVPTIVAITENEWKRRQRIQADRAALHANRNAPRLAKPEYVDPTEVRKLIRSLGRA